MVAFRGVKNRLEKRLRNGYLELEDSYFFLF